MILTTKMVVSRKYRSSLLASLLAILVASAGAQNPATSQKHTPPQKFDEATIRPSPPDRTGPSAWWGVRVTGDMFEAHSMPLAGLVGYAYTFGEQQRQKVADSAGWIESQEWDIVAKVDDPSFAGLSSLERTGRMCSMVQALLEERFHLKLHTELRPTSVYALVQAKGGAHVKEVPAPPEMQGDWMEAMKRDREENPGKAFPGVITCSDRCTATATTISGALGQIEYSAGRTIIDETGLKGHYDFSFRNPADNKDDDALAQAMEDLGMKLESRKMDLTTYVIDSAEKPSPN